MNTQKAIKWLYSLAVTEKNPNAVEALQVGIKALENIKAIQFNCYALNKLTEDFYDGTTETSPDV